VGQTARWANSRSGSDSSNATSVEICGVGKDTFCANTGRGKPILIVATQKSRSIVDCVLEIVDIMGASYAHQSYFFEIGKMGSRILSFLAPLVNEKVATLCQSARLVIFADTKSQMILGPLARATARTSTGR
jgi:hypothetical protein